MTTLSSLDLATLGAAYASGALTPSTLVRERLGSSPGQGKEKEKEEEGIWIARVSPKELLDAALGLERRRAAGEALPLYGIPFAVKDNIDVAGLPTTAGCPSFAYQPVASAPVVERLLRAGALLVGKTNLDQFATGLVGVRSPYGVPRNPFDARYIVGGSSSGSAAAVARGLVSFALGTDTAGSGRVPAAFTNLVGLKPSRGLFSTTGVVPACRSLDCVSVFGLTVADTQVVAGVLAGFDAADPYSRREAAAAFFSEERRPRAPRLGVLRASDLGFFGDDAAARLFHGAVERFIGLGAVPVEVDLAPFREAARLLYEGPWIAERLAGLQPFLEEHPEAWLPVTREIVSSGKGYSAAQAFAATHRLEALKQVTAPVWEKVDALLVPTAPTIYRIDEIEGDPIRLNGRLGTYTNFVNLLDLAALALPAGFRPDGLPLGITLVGPWGSDARLASLGAAHEAALGGTLGATGQPRPAPRPESSAVGSRRIDVAVVGAHLSGMPLNHQLVELGGRLERACSTAPLYRLFSLPETHPPKPGLVRVAEGETGTAIEIEVWSLPRSAFGAFFANVKAPLGIGTLELEDGSSAAGFLCESYAVAKARDISSFGGWRAFRRAAG